MATRVIAFPTRERLGQIVGSKIDGLFPFLEMLTLDFVMWDDEFQSDTLHGGYQSTASGAGAVAAAVLTGAVNGQIRLTTGTDNGGRSDLSLGLHYRGDQGCAIAVRVASDVISSYKLEVGFTDVISGTDAGAVNVLATPTWTATDAVVWAIDTNNDGNYRGLGVANGTASAVVAPAIAPTAATFEWLCIQLDDGAAQFTRLDAAGRQTYQSGWTTGMVTATVLLTPWVFAQARTASASKNVDIDRILVWQRRTDIAE